MDDKYILTIDVGTSSMRSILYDINGHKKYTSSRLYNPTFYENGFVEQDPRDFKVALYETIIEVMGKYNGDPKRVVGVSVTSQRASVIPVDVNGKPLYNAIMWQDKRSYAISQRMKEEFDIKKIYLKTGIKIDPYFVVPKILWIKENEPELYCVTYKMLGIQDYIIYLLTGRYVTDHSQACRTLLMDLSSFKWDDELIEQFGIDKSLLCDLVKPGSIVGDVLPEVAEQLKLASGTPVIIAGGDQQCAALGLNVLEPGRVEANTGTGSFVIAYSDKPVFDSRMRTLCSASAIPGKWIVEAGLLTSGTIYRWFNSEFFDDELNSYEKINEAAANSPVGANGVVVLPHFKGSAAPYWNPLSKGMIYNLNLNTTKGDIARAILEGIVLENAQNIDIIASLIGRVDAVSVAGGLTNFDTYNQIQADAYNKRVEKYKNSEASSLGAFMSAAVTLGYFKSYKEAFESANVEKPVTYHVQAKNVMKYMKLKKRKKILYYALNEMDVFRFFTEPI
ncbi:FGGY-family carbohydrate kinase [Defluviitalea phaphyphila]|uniref:FGGY-family carbohydrate kinase n=1 Tax=Defluviitalea phaphyphila TaxID=1473580 RepID=UPI00072FB566|nr:FGGY-family carbohydrate kinase [Defluviitalea phaphyphila]